MRNIGDVQVAYTTHLFHISEMRLLVPVKEKKSDKKNVHDIGQTIGHKIGQRNRTPNRTKKTDKCSPLSLSMEQAPLYIINGTLRLRGTQ